MIDTTNQQILDFFHKNSHKSWHLRSIQKRLGITSASKLRRTLNELVKERKLVRTGKRVYRLHSKKKQSLFEGYLQVTAQGYGFVLSESGGDDMLIAEEDLLGAWTGDRVLAKALVSRGRSRGRIVKVVGRKSKNILGTLEYYQGYALLRPDETRLHTLIKLLPKSVKNLEAGTRILVKLNWPEESGRTEVFGEVIEVLGLGEDDTEAETRAVIIKHELKENFNSQALTEAKNCPTEITKKMAKSLVKSRLDLQNITTFTIDGIDAKDFDDALSLEKLKGFGKKAKYRVGVHIADVTHYVKEGSALDKEARERATSVYLPGHVLPMLPAELSNGICSLVEGETRLSFSVMIDLDRQANVKNVSFKKTIIKSNARLTYEEVQAFIEGEKLPKGKGKLKNSLKPLIALSQILRQKRLEKGALDFAFTEARVNLDSSGGLQVIPIRSNSSRQLIEEFMLLANRLVAKELMKKEIPGLFRVHKEPNENKIQELQKSLAKLGYNINLKNYRPQDLQSIIQQATDKPEAELVNMLILRSLKQAHYSPENLGHFGLAFEHYLHFTSPIRRYPDLIVHRILDLSLRDKLTSKLKQHYQKNLPELAEHVSELERKAEDAERELVRYYQALWAKIHLGEVFKGTISGVKNFGFFVALTNGVEGLVSINSLADHYIYNEDNLTLTGEFSRQVYKLGQHLEICIANANPIARQVDLIPATLMQKNKLKPQKETVEKKSSPQDNFLTNEFEKDTAEKSNDLNLIKSSPSKKKRRKLIFGSITATKK